MRASRPQARYFLLLAHILTGVVLAFAQQLPDTLDGYKVEDRKVTISQSWPSDDRFSDDVDVYLLIDRVRLRPGVFHALIEVDVGLISVHRSGEIERVTFEGLKLNGVELAAQPYSQAVKVEKRRRIRLPVPIRAAVSITAAARLAYEEMVASSSRWRITGTAYVYGRFRRFGFTFKRVVPIRLDLSIANPLGQ